VARPGESTARACTTGRLDLAAAVGVLLLLHAADAREAAAATQWLAGGLSQAARDVRSVLQDTLALLEAGLDFTDGETGEVDPALWRPALDGTAARLRELVGSLPAAAPGGEVLVLGRSNAGKSSLCNALVGRPAALVADEPGTTRDLLRIELLPGTALWDAPGDLDRPDVADAAALQLRERLAGRAAAVLCVLDATAPEPPESAVRSPLPWLAVVWTKCDLADPPPLPGAVAERVTRVADRGVPVFATSSVDGGGLEPLRQHLQRAARAGVVDAGGPLRTAFREALAAVERARAVPPSDSELVAAELQGALRALDGIAGGHSPEQLLDRIYGRFCLGK
jgi:tRNA modification GTPase